MSGDEGDGADGRRTESESASGDDHPRVSVVIPAYDRADLVGRAVDSALAQTMGDLEVVVVDDGSTDDTAAVVAAYDDPRVRLVCHEVNRGRSAARNTGIDAARGEYVAFLDSDDEWLPRKLERQLAVLGSRGPEWVGVYCDYLPTDTSRVGALTDLLSASVFSRPTVREGGAALAREVLLMHVFMGPGSTLLVERAVLDRTGGFDEGLSVHEDWDLVLDVLEEGKLAHVDEPLVVLHEGGADPPTDEFVASKRAFLARHEDRVRALAAAGDDVGAVHDTAIACLYLRDARFRDAAGAVDRAVLADPLNWARLAWCAGTGVRRRLGV